MLKQRIIQLAVALALIIGAGSAGFVATEEMASLDQTPQAIASHTGNGGGG